MTVTTIRSPPALQNFTLLSQHQEQTPDTFYGGKAILHHHVTNAKAWIPSSQSGLLPFFPADCVEHPTGSEGAALNGTAGEKVEQRVDVFVNTENLAIFCAATESGVQIPYKLISLHALQKAGCHKEFESVFLQLELTGGGGDDDDEFDTVELTLIPPVASTEEAAKLFEAISACSALHPDEVDDDDDDRVVFERDLEPIEGFSGVYQGGTDGHLPPALSSSGWITAENVDRFFDKDGNWITEVVAEGSHEGLNCGLGAGAGTVHTREKEELQDSKEAGVDVESKRARMD